jgi:hypothetical protein
VEKSRGLASFDIAKEWFSRLLSRLVKALLPVIKENIRSGFQKCGIDKGVVSYRLFATSEETRMENKSKTHKAIAVAVLIKLTVIHQCLQSSCAKSTRKRIAAVPGKSVCLPEIELEERGEVDIDNATKEPEDVHPINAEEAKSDDHIKSPKPLCQRITERQKVTSSSIMNMRKRKCNQRSPEVIEKLARQETPSKKNARCSVCGTLWFESKEEWLQCTSCSQWACESCFLSNTCANCEE